jgi:hypothetical protein
MRCCISQKTARQPTPYPYYFCIDYITEMRPPAAYVNDTVTQGVMLRIKLTAGLQRAFAVRRSGKLVLHRHHVHRMSDTGAGRLRRRDDLIHPRTARSRSYQPRVATAGAAVPCEVLVQPNGAPWQCGAAWCSSLAFFIKNW